MWVSKLNLTNFRNYTSLDLELPSHLAVFHGDNAQGKTNILEAIWMLSTTKSYRTANEKELINHNIDHQLFPISRLFAEIHRSIDSVCIELVLNPGEGNQLGTSKGLLKAGKRIRVNNIVKRSIDAVGQLNVVMFTANDIDLVSGTPSIRRRYLDVINSQVDPHYRRCLLQYHKVIWQRNRLLSTLQHHRAQADQLEFWNSQLVETGSYLVSQRRKLVTALNKLLPPIYEQLTCTGEELQAVYLSSVKNEGDSQEDISMEFHRALALSLDKEILRGVSLTGPHRDDLRFDVGNTDMGIYGSRGQLRTIALSLRLAEAYYVYSETGDSPVLLLDDVLPELDKTRRSYLLQFILSCQQVLITATELDFFEPSFLSMATHFKVNNGYVEQYSL